MKYEKTPVFHWVLYGKGALVVFNSGWSIFGQAVVIRINMIQGTTPMS